MCVLTQLDKTLRYFNFSKFLEKTNSNSQMVLFLTIFGLFPAISLILYLVIPKFNLLFSFSLPAFQTLKNLFVNFSHPQSIFYVIINSYLIMLDLWNIFINIRNFYWESNTKNDFKNTFPDILMLVSKSVSK